MPSDVEIDALIERLNVLCNPLSEMLPERERLTAFVRDGDEAARFLAALRDERDRLKSGNRYAQLEQQARARVRELEKKLERARVALHVGLDLISEEKGWGTYPRMEGSEIYAEADVFRELARTTLAEIGQRG